MLLAVIITLLKLQSEGIIGWELIVGGLAIGSLIGYLMATRVEMTGMPELVALFNGFGGAASALVGLSEALKRISEGVLGRMDYTIFKSSSDDETKGWLLHPI